MAFKDRYGRTLEEQRDLRDKMEKANQEARDRWDDPSFHRELAADLTETINEGFAHENLLSLMTTVRNLGFGDREIIEEVRGLKAFWVARGGYIEASTINSETMEVPRDTVGFHVNEFEDKILTNFALAQSQLIDLGTQRLDAEINRYFLSLFQAAIDVSHDSYVAVANLTSNISALNTAIAEVEDESKSGDIAIVGRATMTRKIVDAVDANSTYAGFLPETNEALLRTGVLGTYRGARIITLKNFKDEDDVAFFPGNELYVLGLDASRAVFWGPLKGREWIEQDNDYWHYRARRDFGAVFHRPERMRRIVDSTVSA